MSLSRENVYGVVYRITNNKNGMIYIGGTANFKKRMSDHLADCSRHTYPNSQLYSDIAKYRNENDFKGCLRMEKICTCFDKESLHENEFRLINAYRDAGFSLYNKVFAQKYPKKKKRENTEFNLLDDIDCLKLANAAKQKGVSRTAVLFAMDGGRLNGVVVDGTPHINNDQTFKNWKPRTRK